MSSNLSTIKNIRKISLIILFLAVFAGVFGMFEVRLQTGGSGGEGSLLKSDFRSLTRSYHNVKFSTSSNNKYPLISVSINKYPSVSISIHKYLSVSAGLPEAEALARRSFGEGGVALAMVLFVLFLIAYAKLKTPSFDRVFNMDLGRLALPSLHVKGRILLHKLQAQVRHYHIKKRKGPQVSLFSDMQI